MTRFVAWVSLALAATPGHGAGLSSLLKAVELRYNRTRSIQVLFHQTYTVQGRPPLTEAGMLYLRKPGRMRWDYSSPRGKLFLCDGKTVYLYTPADNRVEKMGLKETEDMRAPLAFLLGKLDFWRDFQKFTSRPEGSDLRITAEPRSAQLPYTKVEFVVTPRREIQYLQITGQDHSTMEFRFSQEQVNPPLADKLFRFQAPPGAELVDSTAADRGGV